MEFNLTIIVPGIFERHIFLSLFVLNDAKFYVTNDIANKLVNSKQKKKKTKREIDT